MYQLWSNILLACMYVSSHRLLVFMCDCIGENVFNISSHSVLTNGIHYVYMICKAPSKCISIVFQNQLPYHNLHLRIQAWVYIIKIYLSWFCNIHKDEWSMKCINVTECIRENSPFPVCYHFIVIFFIFVRPRICLLVIQDFSHIRSQSFLRCNNISLSQNNLI